MADLHLPLKGIYFDAIRQGRKTEEYRLVTPFWVKRLAGRSYDRVVLTRGYPKKGDPERTEIRPWAGCERKTITHPHFGAEPVEVFAIQLP